MKNLRGLLSLAICASALTLTSCRASRPVTESVSTSDTVERFTTVTPRDTVLIAPSASTSLELSIKELLKGEPISLKQAEKQATVSVRTSPDGKQLLIGCNCDTLAITAELRDRYDRERATSITTKTIKVPEAFIPWWVSVLAWTGGIGIVAVSIALAANRFLPRKPV